jgi:hypothetical protein
MKLLILFVLYLRIHKWKNFRTKDTTVTSSLTDENYVVTDNQTTTIETTRTMKSGNNSSTCSFNDSNSERHTN